MFEINCMKEEKLKTYDLHLLGRPKL
jgi:hypothetical protein